MKSIKHFAVLSIILLFLYASNAAASENPFVQYDQPSIAITNVNIIDGTGAAIKFDQTVLMEDGVIKAITDADKIRLDEKTIQIDGTNKTLIPGLVMMHEHLFYPTGKLNYTEMLHSFPKLYLAGGVTTMRTAGTMAPYADLNLRDAINQGHTVGPDMDVTAPYLNGPGLPIYKVNVLEGVADTQKVVEYWLGEGASSYKAYMHIRGEELAEVIRIAHKNKQKVTGHLCSVTYTEAAELGIDNLEHGFFPATDFVKNKKKDVCPSDDEVSKSFVDFDVNSKQVDKLINTLVKNDVALTSTLTIYETFVAGRPKAPEEALAVLIPQVRAQYENTYDSISKSDDSTWQIIFKKGMQLEKRFVEAGGTLLVGTDPTGYGGVIAGFSSKRAIELLVEAGFTIEQAIHFSSLNGARFMGKDHSIGSIEIGKKADLVLVDGRLDQNVESINNMPSVFKNGIGYSTQAIIDANKETVGLH